ncbi:ABC transporter substrate-binding protein [Actinacidiphila bryophytorum]|uniref:ABC transporter substrate-binding protein n=1 Tax=Actinacidiphila bryophytorum TaxID=1436133 RepID=UPI0021769BB5|nr:ABC transporter substrate-binding protein [Actinacidiphila bryophytorum]UWE07887.1 ABC transporter substrate-binding protein [Actinacidiphila bryophytorum]
MINRRVRACGTALAAALLLTAAAGCGSGGKDQPAAGGAALATGAAAAATGDQDLVVGSAGFTESAILAAMYAKVLDKAGFHTTVKTLANRELYEPALEKGQIDVVPEYAATLAEFLNTKANGAGAKPVASSDVTATVAALTELADQRGLKVLPAGKAVDQNAFAVSKDFAEQHHLKTLSDLGAAKVKITLAAGDECPDRPYCEPGLKKTYGIDVVSVDPKGVGTTQSKQAVQDGTDQLVLTTTTDATLDQFDLVLLTDDKHLQNADNVLPVLNAQDAADPKAAAALGKLTAVLTTADLTELNKKVDAERQKPEDVAADYLDTKGL